MNERFDEQGYTLQTLIITSLLVVAAVFSTTILYRAIENSAQSVVREEHGYRTYHDMRLSERTTTTSPGCSIEEDWENLNWAEFLSKTEEVSARERDECLSDYRDKQSCPEDDKTLAGITPDEFASDWRYRLTGDDLSACSLRHLIAQISTLTTEGEKNE